MCHTTIHLPYTIDNEEDFELLKTLIVQYNSIIRVQANNILEDRDIDISKLNHIDLLDGWYINCGKKDAVRLVDSLQKRYNEIPNDIKKVEKEIKFWEGQKDQNSYVLYRIKKLKKQLIKLNRRLKRGVKFIAGTKAAFHERIKGTMTHEEWKKESYSPVCCEGEKNSGTTRVHGNRKGHLTDDLSGVIYKIGNKYINLKFKTDKLSKKYQRQFELLYRHQLAGDIPITYKIDFNEVYITFDAEQVLAPEQKGYNYIDNRILGIDMNPNYVGVTIADWKSSTDFKVVKSVVYSTKEIFDKYKELNDKHLKSNNVERVHLSNKVEYNSHFIANEIIKMAIYYKCQMVSYEGLDIDSKDLGMGKDTNYLVNNLWNRNAFRNTLEKQACIHHVKIGEATPEYSSFVGNILFADLNLPDMCLAAFEISRRGYEYYIHYNEQISKKDKIIILPEQIFPERLAASLEEKAIPGNVSTLVGYYNYLKKRKIMYRLSIDQFNLQFSNCLSASTMIKQAVIL